jgi:hypothetical protein
MWLVIIIVCIIFGFIIQPVDRIIKKNVSSKWLAIILQLVASFIILMALYGIAILFGFNIWK